MPRSMREPHEDTRADRADGLLGTLAHVRLLLPLALLLFLIAIVVGELVLPLG